MGAEELPTRSQSSRYHVVDLLVRTKTKVDLGPYLLNFSVPRKWTRECYLRCEKDLPCAPLKFDRSEVTSVYWELLSPKIYSRIIFNLRGLEKDEKCEIRRKQIRFTVDVEIPRKFQDIFNGDSAESKLRPPEPNASANTYVPSSVTAREFPRNRCLKWSLGRYSLAWQIVGLGDHRSAFYSPEKAFLYAA